MTTTTREPTVLPVPAYLEDILAIHDGDRWLRNIVPDSIEVHGGTITFVMIWKGDGRRRVTLSLAQVTGYQVTE